MHVVPILSVTPKGTTIIDIGSKSALQAVICTSMGMDIVL